MRKRTGVKIDVQDDGQVNVASADEAAAAKAIGIIQELTATAELNKTYLGKVQRITDFGAQGEVRVEDGRIILDVGDPLTGITWRGALPTRLWRSALECQRTKPWGRQDCSQPCAPWPA